MKFSPRPSKQRASSGKQSRNPQTLFGAIDLGTNNCRMLIARPTRHSFHVVDSFSRITRLGQNLVNDSQLCPEAMERTIKALQVCANKLKSRNVSKVRCVATEACRRASNADTFLQRVQEETGLTLESIRAEEEARLALTGCASLLKLDKSKALVFDIGGGSTEIMWIDLSASGEPSVVDVISLPLGVVTLYEKYGHNNDLPDMAYAQIKKDVQKIILSFEKKNDISSQIKQGRVQMLGTSGTVTTLGAVYLDLPKYLRSRVDGMVLPLEQITRISQNLANMSCQERAAHPCIGKNRSDLVMSGCAILEALCDIWPVPELTIADRGIREGILINLMGK